MEEAYRAGKLRAIGVSNFYPERLVDVAAMAENFDVFDFELDAEDTAAFAALDDGTLPRIFDHYDPKVVGWLVRDLVRTQQLGGGTLY